MDAFFKKVAEEKAACPDADPSWHQELAAYGLAEAGEVKWPPDTTYLIGIETKCSYLTLDGELKSTKSSERKVEVIRGQIAKLEALGFDRVVLLDWIANPPVRSDVDGQAWIGASAVAQSSLERMWPTLEKRLPDESAAGHWVHSMGAVDGGDERERGAGLPVRVREGRPIRIDDGSAAWQRREEMNENLKRILEGFASPRGPGLFGLSVFFLDCRACGRIHGLRDGCR
jgi:hypothetical protein